MSLTVRKVANDCLAHIDRKLSNTTPFSTGTYDDGTLLPHGCEEYLVNTLNLALEEMREKAPTLFRQTIGITFTGSTSGTASVTSESKALTLSGVTPANGCTVQLANDSVYNEIRSTGGSNYELLYAYGGSTGSQTITAYGDSVVLPANVDCALGVVATMGQRTIESLNSRSAWLFHGSVLATDYGRQYVDGPTVARRFGRPEAVWIESAFASDGTIEYRAHCAPLPSGRFPVDLEVVTIPTAIVAADLNASATYVFPVPGDRFYGIFRALALYHWQSAPWFANEKARKMLDRGYADAVAQLEGFRANRGTSLNLQTVGM